MYKAYLSGEGNVVRSKDLFYPERPTAPGPRREPLGNLGGYCGWISTSGLPGSRACEGTHPSLDLRGANMGFRARLTGDFPLARLYGRSRKCLWFEQILAYQVATKGYRAYMIKDADRAPTVYHITHGRSLTRGRGFWHEFRLHYDRVAMLWRLRELGTPVSLLRKNTVLRLLATTYGLLTRV